MMFHYIAVGVIVVFLCVNRIQSEYSFHPKFKRIYMERSFDESSGRCKYFDKLYKEGQSIIPDEDCEYQCTCHVSEHYEGFLCEPLCPRYIDDACSPGWTNVPKMVPAGPEGSGCLCTEPNCVPSEIEAFRLR